MNRNMTARTLATGLEAEPPMGNTGLSVKTGVALQAQLASFTPYQQHAVGTAMGIVASGAAFHLHRGMLVNVGPALFLMAIQAAVKSRPVQAGAVDGTMGIVAISALDQPFRNPMVHRQSELGLHGSVAVEAQCWLRLLEQTAVQPADFVGQLRHLIEVSLRVSTVALALVFDFGDQVRGMALIARQPMGDMGRVLKKLLLLAADVAEHAMGCILFRSRAKMKDGELLQGSSDLGVDREGKDGMLFKRPLSLAFIALSRLDGVGVRFARPVTDFTTRNEALSGDRHSGVGGLFVLPVFRFVAGAAAVYSGVIILVAQDK